jgi:hypothetical protein
MVIISIAGCDLSRVGDVTIIFGGVTGVTGVTVLTFLTGGFEAAVGFFGGRGGILPVIVVALYAAF